jgi:hypothetical protein
VDEESFMESKYLKLGLVHEQRWKLSYDRHLGKKLPIYKEIGTYLSMTKYKAKYSLK